MGRAVTFIGAADVFHCSGMVRAGGSKDVFVNGIGVSRQGDVNTKHKKPPFPCPPHQLGGRPSCDPWPEPGIQASMRVSLLPSDHLPWRSNTSDL